MSVITLEIKKDEIDKLKNIYHTDDDEQAVREAISYALRQNNFQKILSLKGKIHWDENLDELRASRI